MLESNGSMSTYIVGAEKLDMFTRPPLKRGTRIDRGTLEEALATSGRPPGHVAEMIVAWLATGALVEASGDVDYVVRSERLAKWGRGDGITDAELRGHLAENGMSDPDDQAVAIARLLALGAI
jgi:hypothetical protein